MSANRILVRSIVGVVISIAAITTVALWLGRANRHDTAAYVPPPRGAPRSPAELGARLYDTKGCVACHSIDASPRVGPSFKGSWGSSIVLDDRVTIVFDEAYVRESLAHPQAQARGGYPPSMPSFDGLLTERETNALIAYLRTLR